MATIKQVTTIEESQKLLELGLDKDTCDAFYRISVGTLGDEIDPMPHFRETLVSLINLKYKIPAWTSSGLLNALPVIDEDIRPIIEKCWNGKYACKYMFFDMVKGTAELYIRRFGDTPVDAAYAMMKYMLTDYKEHSNTKEE